MKQTHYSHSYQDTIQIAQTLAKSLKSGDVVAYRGGLGAGKTAFTCGLAAGLSLDAEVSSPTFALVHEYPGKLPLYHFDMYRIETMDDLYSTGFFDYLELPGIVVIEWSENIDNLLPEHTLFVEFSVLSESERKIEIYRNA